MSSKLIELQDGLLIEAEVPEDEVRPISGGAADRVESSMDVVKPILLKACKPITEVWGELNKDMSVEQVDVELGLGFEATGDMFIVKGTGSANLKVKVTIKPKQ